MNLTLLTAFWRERFTSPVRLLLLFMLWSFSILIAFLKRPAELPAAEWTIWLTLTLGAGIIGRDLSTGVLQLILARPVRRWEYVLSRWFALGTAVFGLAFLSWAIAAPFSVVGGGTTINEALARILESYFIAYGLAAVITGFSALLPGFGDLALWLVGLMFSFGIGAAGHFTNRAWAARLAHEIQATLIPTMPVDDMAANGFLLYPIVVWVSTVTLSLLLGVYAMNRRELSYATVA